MCKLQEGALWLKAGFQNLEGEGSDADKASLHSGKGNQCVYTRHQDEKWTHLLASVEDLIISYERDQDCNDIVHSLNEEMEIKELATTWASKLKRRGWKIFSASGKML